MIRINYYCSFLKQDRSLFVGSEKVMNEEIARLNKCSNPIKSIELPK